MGLDSLLQQNMQNAGLSGIDRLASNAMFPQAQMDKTQYSVSSQMPTGAETLAADYDAPTNSYTGMPTKPFAAGGIASIPRFDGEDGSQVQAWDPTSGTVKLQKLVDPNDPYSDVTTVDYTVPKDNIKQFVQDIDSDTNTGLGSGQYILNDGSTMRVSADGIVQSATPARDEYTLNEQGYYQPTGSGLTWRGDQNSLTKKIGGVDVNVPGIYHKGGYQDAQGNLRVDANGVPIALAPNYLDSGFGKSGLSDAAPYIAMAAMAAATMGASAPESMAMLGGETAIEGGSMAAGTDFFGGLAGTEGAAGGMTAAEQAAQLTGTYGMGPTYAELGYAGAGAPSTAEAIAAADAASKAAAAGGGGLTAKQAYAAKMGLDMLNSGAQSGGGGQAGSAPQIAAAPTTPTINRFGVTGYEGNAITPNLNLSPITLSKIKGAAGEQYFAAGGIASLGSYSDGGQLLKGPGDGMSDNIPAKIGQAQPARLADGEFVVPADVVSHLGNGSTDAGAKQLYAMMDKIRKARTGTKKQGKRINPSKFLP